MEEIFRIEGLRGWIVDGLILLLGEKEGLSPKILPKRKIQLGILFKFWPR